MTSYGCLPPGAPGAANSRGPDSACQSDDLLLSTVLVTPTSTASLPMLHRPEVVILGERTCLLVEQTRAINRESLGPSVGRLSYDDLRQLDDALRLALALDG